MTVPPTGEYGRSVGERESARQPSRLADPIVAALEPATTPPTPGEKRLELLHISKSFGGVRVLQDVSMDLGSSEVVGLLGDNGAGKSTLIKIITGVHRPDAGEIRFGGRRVGDLTVQKARALGVETVYQERAIADQLPLWRNIFMGRAVAGPLGFLKVGEMRRTTHELMGESMGFTSAVLTPDTVVKGLSGGERQGLAIVRALHFQADIIILDEPTMGLSLKETEKLLRFVEGIRAAGKSAIFIDHNIFHVYSVADRIIVLDRGRVAGQFPTSRYSLEELLDIMREVAARGTFTEQERYRLADKAPEATTGVSEPHA
jgi:simple sugar transport system ATP-binding protein